MAAEPDKDFPFDRDPETPRWLGSAVRRGLNQEHGVGWTEEEIYGEGARPKWLGSVARRDGTRNADGSGWVEPEETEEAERPMWTGSVARRGDPARSLVLIDMGVEPGEGATEKAETPQAADPTTANESAPSLKETLKPAQAADELEDRRKSQEVIGDLGIHLRVA
jgi:hypothetical protein